MNECMINHELEERSKQILKIREKEIPERKYFFKIRKIK